MITRSKSFRFGLAVLLLIFLDQLSKLLVNALVPRDSLNSVFYTQSDAGWFMFHLHPLLHNRYSLPVGIAIAVIAAVYLVMLVIYHKYERAVLLRDIPDSDLVKSSPRLTEAALIFWIAGLVCSTLFDSLLWGGSLDFLCVEWARFYTDAAGPYTISRQIDVDLKDVYLAIGVVLLLARIIIFNLSQYKLPKSSRKLISSRSFHLIRGIRELRGKAAEPSEKDDLTGKNSIADIAVIVVMTMLAAFAFGYAIFILTVYILIPIAVELVPPLERYLTEIGRNNDPEEIYAAIRSVCLLIGILPGSCVANAAVKNRERLFIGDTGGKVTVPDGLKYHFRQHLVYDIISVAGIAAVGLAMSLLGQDGFSAFGAVYKAVGLPLGLILSALISAAAQFVGIAAAQNIWRADYFYGE